MKIFFLCVPTVSDFVSISKLGSLVGVPVGIVSSARWVKTCAITVGNKKCRSNIKKKEKTHNEKMLLAKTSLNTTKVWISQAFIDSYVTHSKFVSVNNMLGEYNEMKEEIKNPENATEYTA